jgi:hypothetical protein
MGRREGEGPRRGVYGAVVEWLTAERRKRLASDSPHIEGSEERFPLLVGDSSSVENGLTNF